MITFIIPTIGRNTLEQSVQSILQQTNPNWKIVILFDGIQSTFQSSNPQIQVVEIEKKGKDRNSAGLVRNEGLQYVDTEWIAFLDDDDTVSPHFVETFYSEIDNYPQTDLLIFRMYNENKNIIHPSMDADNFYMNDVGISFVVKRNVFSKIQFVPSSVEDFNYLDEVRRQKYVIMISPYVEYYVNGLNDSNKKFNLGRRVLLNDKKTIEFFFSKVRSDSNMSNWLYMFISIMIFIVFVLYFYRKHLIKQCKNIAKHFRIGFHFI